MTNDTPTPKDVLKSVNEALDNVEWAIAQYNQVLEAKAGGTPLSSLKNTGFESAIVGAAQYLRDAERLIFGWEPKSTDATEGAPALGSMRINDEDDTHVLFEL